MEHCYDYVIRRNGVIGDFHQPEDAAEYKYFEDYCRNVVKLEINLFGVNDPVTHLFVGIIKNSDLIDIIVADKLGELINRGIKSGLAVTGYELPTTEQAYLILNTGTKDQNGEPIYEFAELNAGMKVGIKLAEDTDTGDYVDYLHVIYNARPN